MHFLVTSDEKFKIHTSTTIASILKWNPGAVVHWISSGIEESDKAKIKKSLERDREQIRFYDAPEISSYFHVDKHASTANYYRIFAPEVIDDSVDRIIYLDSDVLVRKNLDDLWSLDLCGGSLAAVWNPSEELSKPLAEITENNYFNSGVMLISLDKWRSKNITKKLVQYIQNSDFLEYWDQDALNWIFKDQWVRLPITFNAQHSFYNGGDLGLAYSNSAKDPHVVHFSGMNLKPWQSSLWNHPFKNEYRLYRKATPWRYFIEEGSSPRSTIKQIVKQLPLVEEGRRRLRNRRKKSSKHQNPYKTASPSVQELQEPLPSLEKVQAGPFHGIKLYKRSVGSRLSPKLVGTYEHSIHPLIQEVISDASIKKILNIGCAEGYYAVGLACLMRKTDVIAYDINPLARRLCESNAEINFVSDRVIVKEECTQNELRRMCTPETLVLCDIEGGEVDLLDPQAVPELLSAKLLVEVHDFAVPDAERIIVERFRRTHRVNIVVDTPYFTRLECFKESENDKVLSLSDAYKLIDEERPAGMRWLWMAPFK